MMEIELDFRSKEPLFTQIADQVRALIASEALRVGDQLPTMRQLAHELRVNFNTVARAYRSLDREGIISTQHGRGSYIWRKPSPQDLAASSQRSLERLTKRYLDQAKDQGYTPAEVNRAIQEAFETWEHETLEISVHQA